MTKILMAKLGLDGHDFGVKVLCQIFRNAGFDVVYTGIRQTPEQVVAAARDEGVDVIGVSILSGAHMHHIPRIMELLDEYGIGHITVIAGGTIPGCDIEELKRLNVAEVFPTDTDSSAAIEFIKGLPAGAH